MPSFSENILISMMGEKLLLEPEQIFEVRRGVEMAMADADSEAVRLERLVAAVEQMGLPENVAVINLWNTPLEELWMRAELKKVQKKLSGHEKAQLVVVGLWHTILQGNKRTAASYRTAAAWREFVEKNLLQVPWSNLEVLWVG